LIERIFQQESSTLLQHFAVMLYKSNFFYQSSKVEIKIVHTNPISERIYPEIIQFCLLNEKKTAGIKYRPFRLPH